MRLFVTFIVAFLATTSGLLAEGPVPERRLALTRNLDFHGADLRRVFDTTLAACQKLCLSEPDCAAFTFNTRSGACFPKRGVTEILPYEGAVSGRVLETDPDVLTGADARASRLGFLREADFKAAKELALQMAGLHVSGERSAEDHLRAAEERLGAGRVAGALAFTGAAINLTDAPDLWVEYGRLSLRLAETERDRRFLHRQRALAAAVNGYLRARMGAVQADALFMMARALESQGRGREIIPALRLAQDIRPRADAGELLAQAVAKYGFRIVEHQVDSDAAQPRICAVFSEDLVPAGLDYAPFVQLPRPGLGVSHEGRQICIEGVEHGARYRVAFREGLPARSGEVLSRTVPLDLYVRDRKPSVRFPGRAYVLPRAGEAALPVETVNLDRVELTLWRISDRNLIRSIQESYFGRPLSRWQEGEFAGNVAEEVWSGTGEVRNELNRDMLTRLPVGEALSGLAPGVYALKAAVPGDERTPAATQWFVLSDIGLATLSGADGLHVFARGLADAEPMAGIELTLLSRANAVLGETVTDARGYARFTSNLAAGRGASEPAVIVARDGEDDLAFLPLTDPAFDLSDRGVEGREPAGAIDAFVATDRGAYRAGETVHATALLRDGNARAIPGLPVTAVTTRPDGVEFRRETSANGMAGGHVFDIPIPASAPRGSWQLALYADPEAPALARARFLVEDFLPERIDFDLSLPDAPIPPGTRPVLGVAARYLFGAPGADLAVEGEVTLAPADGLDGFPGYVFGRHDRPLAPLAARLPDGLRTGAGGRVSVPIDLPRYEEAPARPFEARVTVRLAEGSGRPVEREITAPVHPEGALIGIRPLFEGVVPEGGEASFDLVGVEADGHAAPMRVRWTVNRVETRFQWYSLNGNWNWEPTTTRIRVAEGELDLSADPARVAVPVEWGRYELRAERLEGPYAESSTGFSAGWYAPAGAVDTPDLLQASLDRPRYAPGDTARLRIVPRYPGKALVTVMSNRLIDMKAVDVVEGENLVELPVTDDWGAGAYVAATVIRPMEAAAGHDPARALGIAHAAIEPGKRQLAVSIDMDAEAKPRGPLDIALEVEGLAEGETAFATVAAVDQGILNLTGHEAPDPSAHYFGQRKLGMGMRDLYGRLIDGSNGAMGAVRSGGDAGSPEGLQAPPPTGELVAFFSGPVEFGLDGRADVSFDLPSFNGTVKVMAMAWSAGGVGRASADVLVRDPVVVTASLPRFLAPGDETRMLLEIVHATGPAGRMGLDVSSGGLTLGPVPSGIDLDKGGHAVLSVPVGAGAAGDQEIDVALTTPDGRQLVRTVQLPVRRNDPEITRVSRLTLGPGDTFALSRDVFAGFAAGTGSATLSAGPIARFDAPGLLLALDRYPYGCTEQVTSRALPLLYLDEVAAAMGLADRERTAARVRAAISKVLTNQGANGAFGLWNPGSGDFWLDAYVTDFLSRARARGFEVRDTALGSALDNLRNRVGYAPDFDTGGEDIAYALYVLAREGAAAAGDLRYYADVKGDAFATPLAAAQLGAALASYGDPARADRMFARAARMLATREAEPPLWRADYGTWRRDAAGVLALSLEAGSEAVSRDALAEAIAPRAGLARASTQEAAWALMAANAMIEGPGMDGLEVNGAPAAGPLVRVLDDEAGAAPIRFTNGSGSDATLTLTTFGVPSEPVAAGGDGFVLTRGYYSMEGDEVAPGEMRAGERYVAVLEVSPTARREARLMVNDPLPAGLEIDNPNLLRGGDVSALDWLRLHDDVRHAEFRQDRFLAAVDWRSDESFRLGYIVRAISPGEFHHPAASVEDMYRPAFRAWTDAGRVSIAE